MVAFVASPKKTSFVGAFLPPEKLNDVNARVRTGNYENRSAYVRELIDADLSGAPSPSTYDAEVLAALAKTYCGWLAPRLAEQLEQANQPKVLAEMLTKLSEYLASGYKLEDMHIVPRAFTTYLEAPDYLRAVAEAQSIYDAQKGRPAAGGGGISDEPPQQTEKKA